MIGDEDAFSFRTINKNCKNQLSLFGCIPGSYNHNHIRSMWTFIIQLNFLLNN